MCVCTLYSRETFSYNHSRTGTGHWQPVVVHHVCTCPPGKMGPDSGRSLSRASVNNYNPLAFGSLKSLSTSAWLSHNQECEMVNRLIFSRFLEINWHIFLSANNIGLTPDTVTSIKAATFLQKPRQLQATNVFLFQRNWSSSFFIAHKLISVLSFRGCSLSSEPHGLLPRERSFHWTSSMVRPGIRRNTSRDETHLIPNHPTWI